MLSPWARSSKFTIYQPTKPGILYSAKRPRCCTAEWMLVQVLPRVQTRTGKLECWCSWKRSHTWEKMGQYLTILTCKSNAYHIWPRLLHSTSFNMFHQNLRIYEHVLHNRITYAKACQMHLQFTIFWNTLRYLRQRYIRPTMAYMQ